MHQANLRNLHGIMQEQRLGLATKHIKYAYLLKARVARSIEVMLPSRGLLLLRAPFRLPVSILTKTLLCQPRAADIAAF